MTKLSLDTERLSTAYRDGVTTPEEVTAEVLRRIESAEGDNVWISRPSADAVMQQAKAVTRRSAAGSKMPLYGLPFAVKDSIDVAGIPTTLACPAFSYMPAESAAVVERLIEAGAIFVGKTNLDQFATGLVGVRSPYGTPRNPFDPAMIPGGSSSGSAVAVATGLVSFAVATDTAGSGRVPAAFNNIVGFKPTRGMFSMNGLVPACRSVDCITLMGLTVEDMLRVGRAMQGFDLTDAYSRRAPAGFALRMGEPAKRFRFGVPRAGQLEFFGDSEAEALFRAAIDRASALGGELAEIDFEPFSEAGKLLYGPWVAERTADLGEFIAAHPDAIHPVVREIIAGGSGVNAADLFRSQHRLAELARAIIPIWRGIDFMLVPTTGTAYRIDEVLADPVKLNTNLGYYTTFANLLNLSAIAVPNVLTVKGFPTGITLIGPAWHDADLATYGAALHGSANLLLGATGIAMSGPPMDQPLKVANAAYPRVEIVVFGAHMRREPLNHELAGLDGTFCRSCRTAPAYRMFVLGGTVERPALARVGIGGVSLEGELWSLPVEAVGAFLARIAPPLGLGKVVLDDQVARIGFICEAGAIESLRDISHFGGWRAYRASLRPAG